jgi:alkylation response protein AidB-like acyl-CoA dehydrogenase
MAQQAWGGRRHHLDIIADDLSHTNLLMDQYAGPSGLIARQPAGGGSGTWAVPVESRDPPLEEFRGEVRAWLADEIDPVIPGQGSFPQGDTPEKKAFLAKLAARGWLGLAWPAEYGGSELDPCYQLVLQQELEYAGMPSASIEVAMLGPTLIRHGDERLKAEFLPRLVRGELTMALGYSEPQAGSDLAKLALRAERDGDCYVLNGQKMWTSAAHFADVIWLACRTDATGPAHHGISIFLVDRTSPGIEVRPITTMAEHRTNMVFFDDVRVPTARLVGEEGQAWSYLMEALDHERLAGFPTGALIRDMDEIVTWVRQDRRWQDVATRRQVAAWVVRVAGALSHHSAALDGLAHGNVPTIEATMLKISMTEARQDLADEVLDLLGQSGLTKGFSPSSIMAGRFEAVWRGEIVTSIAGGANELQRNIIAQRHLGLPRR